MTGVADGGGAPARISRFTGPVPLAAALLVTVILSTGCAPLAGRGAGPGVDSAIARSAVANPVEASAARYKGWLVSGGRKHRFRADLYAARPDRLRCEISTPLGQTVFSLIVSGDRFVLLVPRERRYASGLAADEEATGLVGGAGLWISGLLADREALAAGGLVETTGSREVKDDAYTRDFGDGRTISITLSPVKPEPPLSIEAHLPDDVTLRLSRSGILAPPDPAAAFPLEPPTGFEEWPAADLLDMIAGEVPGESPPATP